MAGTDTILTYHTNKLEKRQSETTDVSMVLKSSDSRCTDVGQTPVSEKTRKTSMHDHASSQDLLPSGGDFELDSGSEARWFFTGFAASLVSALISSSKRSFALTTFDCR